MLDAPRSREELYLARGAVDAYRPICQGDVFLPMLLPERDEECMALVASHPCAMRAGPRLRDRVTLVPVISYQSVALDAWSSGHYRCLPLPELLPDAPDDGYAAMLDEPVTVSSHRLDPIARVALLTDTGITLLQQRSIHNLSRFAPPLSALREVSAAVLEELELQETWNLALAAPSIEAGSDLAGVLESEAENFDAVMMRVPDGYDCSYRALLKEPSSRSMVRRAVTAEIDARKAA